MAMPVGSGVLLLLTTHPGEALILKKLFVPIFAPLLLCFVLIPQCHAWGREGHRLTALVAQEHLSPTAEANVRYLLGKDTLADVAPWADEYREDHRETAPWHFVEIPGAQDTYDRLRDCPLSEGNAASPWRDCVVDRILYFEDQLKDPAVNKKQKEFALKFLVHLIGDIHQPFHTIATARGGNTIQVTFFCTPQCGPRSLCNLHGVWDDELIDHQDLSEKKYVAHLDSEILEHNWDKLPEGDPISWANASHHYAQAAFVPNNTPISSDYYDKTIKVVDQQLALGGLRLADVLNRIFTDPPPTT